MSKIIKITPDLIEQCRTEFDQVLQKAKEDFNTNLTSAKCANGKVDFTFARYVKDFGSQQRRATLQFSELSWYKMSMLIQEYPSEVGWHGIAFRDEDESKDIYYIKDIVIYPQMVDGTNVNTDQEKYERWLYTLSDEQFNNLRMHGHSHVTMGCTPSVTDEDHQSRILSQLEGDMFYVFMIYNKSYARNIRIYDMKKNVLFENSDVDVKVINDGLGFEDLLEESRTVVEKKTFSANKNTSSVAPFQSAWGKYYAGKESAVKTAEPDKETIVTAKEEKKKEKPAKKEKKKESFKEFSSPKSACYYDDNDLYGYSDYDEDDCYRRYGSMASDPFYAYDGYYNGKYMN